MSAVEQGTLRLTDQQRREYDQLGYTLVPGVFPAGEMAALDIEIERLQAQTAAEKKPGEGWVMRLGLRSEITRGFCADQRLLGLVEDIVKPGIAIYSAKLVPKLPYDEAVCHWHQDDAYYAETTPSDTRMSVWVPLHDSDKDNGCLWVVPQSHTWGLQAWRQEGEGYCNRALQPPDDFDFSQAVPVPAKAGDVLLFSALLWHSSQGNRSERLRRAFIVSYQEATVQGGNKDQWKILRPA
jgi:phytanoyl-CoA hydroxylase